jgi:hypothetical protein
MCYIGQLRELNTFPSTVHLDVIQHGPLLHTLTRLHFEEAIGVMKPLALLLPLMTSLHELYIDTQGDEDESVLDTISPWYFPSTLRHLTFIHDTKLPPLILPKELTHLCIDRKSMNLDDIMKSWPHLYHLEYRNSWGNGPTIEPSISSIVKWKSFKGRLSKHELPLITLCMPSLTTLQLTCPFNTFDELATMLMNLPPSLINININKTEGSLKEGDSAFPFSSRRITSQIILKECRELELFGMNQDLADRLILPNLNTFILGHIDYQLGTFAHRMNHPINLTSFFGNAPSIRKLDINQRVVLSPQLLSPSLPSSGDDSKRGSTRLSHFPNTPILLSLLQSLSLSLHNHINEVVLPQLIQSRTLKSLSIRSIDSTRYGSYDITPLIPSLLQLSPTSTSLTFINCDHQPIIDLLRSLEHSLCHLQISQRKCFPNMIGNMIGIRNEMMKAVPYLADIDFY